VLDVVQPVGERFCFRKIQPDRVRESVSIRKVDQAATNELNNQVAGVKVQIKTSGSHSLFENLPAADAVAVLMERDLRREHEEE